MRNTVLLLLRFALLAAALCGVYAGAPAPLAQENFIAERNIAVSMRDGVVLRADVMRPRAEGRYPVLIYRTPYGKDGAQKDYTTSAKAVARGYAVVIQDVRGRYHSDGEFDA